MALKVKAVERKLKFSKDENDPGVYRYELHGSRSGCILKLPGQQP